MDTTPFDVVVIGGGPAGLQAALTLGRMHRTVLMLDSGHYRNAVARHLHNFVTHDGTAPDEFRSAGRAGLQAYDTVQVCDVAATEVSAHGDDWQVSSGGTDVVHARTVLLATGLRDTLPDKPGLADLWGDLVASCPYCHGHEFSGRHVAILGNGPHVVKVGALIERIASRVTVLADGGELDEATSKQLADAGIGIRAEPVTGVHRSGSGATVGFERGPDEEVGGLFVTTELAQSAPFADQLGLDLLPSGCVRIDELGRTSRPGVYAAGDLAHVAALPMPLASVLTAAAAGLLAATAADQDLMALDLGLAVPA